MSGIELMEAASPSHIFWDLSRIYASLAFIASSDIPRAHEHSAELAAKHLTQRHLHRNESKQRTSPSQMPKLAQLFLRFMQSRDDSRRRECRSCTFDVAYAIPIKLKYECLPSSKFGNDPSLWKIETTYFLKVTKQIEPQISTIYSSMIFHNEVHLPAC